MNEISETSNRRKFLHLSGAAGVACLANSEQGTSRKIPAVTLFFCGDVMTGRGIDQVLPYSCDPQLHEEYVKSSLEYVRLAERINGPIPKPVSYSYVWGAALKEFERVKPHVRIINLETAITTSNDWVPKGINYRMHPRNIPCITAAGINCCVVANNHVLDWGYPGLTETLRTLQQAKLKPVGAGHNQAEAWQPAAIEIPGSGRVLVAAYGTESSGVPQDWAATQDQAGIALLPNLSGSACKRVAETVRSCKQPGDIIVASIHWGGNWGYTVPSDQQAFAHALIDEAAVDVVHGHSSHHPRGIEVYKNKPILYGCGDFLNDYEGIRGYEEFRSQLVLMYFPVLDTSRGDLLRFTMIPLEIRRFRLEYASQADAQWLADMLTREGKRFRTRAILGPDNTLTLEWQ